MFKVSARMVSRTLIFGSFGSTPVLENISSKLELVLTFVGYRSHL